MYRKLVLVVFVGALFVMTGNGCSDSGSGDKGVTIKDGKDMDLKSLPPPSAPGEGASELSKKGGKAGAGAAAQ